jgi:hypothetical protein
MKQDNLSPGMLWYNHYHSALQIIISVNEKHYQAEFVVDIYFKKSILRIDCDGLFTMSTLLST